MASKNTDIIEQLADTICGNLVATSTKNGKETAPNDKTYPSIIIGVNQKFTDDVSEPDATSLVQKFRIPEKVDDGDNSYYTFKIDGVYYCKRQNGNFKLYQRVMAYVPNNDWSNIYLDCVESESDEDVDCRHIYYDIFCPPVAGETYSFIDDFIKSDYNQSDDDQSNEEEGSKHLWHCDFWIRVDKNSKDEKVFIKELWVLQGNEYIKADFEYSTTEPEVDQEKAASNNYYWIKYQDSPDGIESLIYDIYKPQYTTEWEWNKTPIVKFRDLPTSNVMAKDSLYILFDNTDITTYPCWYWTVDEETSATIGAYFSTSRPPNRYDVWVQIDNYAFKNITNIYDCDFSNYDNVEPMYGVRGYADLMWVNRSTQKDQKYEQLITLTEEPVMPADDTIGNDDYWIAYKIDWDYGTNAAKYTFTYLLQFYYADWVQITSVMSGMTLPETFVGGSPDYFVLIDITGMPIALYENYNKDATEPDWKEIDSKRTIVNAFRPLKENDYWAKVDDYKSRGMISLYRYIKSSWELMYNSRVPVIYSSNTDPTLEIDTKGNPVNNVHLGDYWAKLNNMENKNIIAFYERKAVTNSQTNTTIPEWVLLYNAPEGGEGGYADVNVNITISRAILVTKDDLTTVTYTSG